MAVQIRPAGTRRAGFLGFRLLSERRIGTRKMVLSRRSAQRDEFRHRRTCDLARRKQCLCGGRAVPHGRNPPSRRAASCPPPHPTLILTPSPPPPLPLTP